MTMKIIYIVAFFVATASFAHSVTIKTLPETVVQGSPLYVEISSQEKLSCKTVTFNSQTIVPFKVDDHTCAALFGIDLTTPPNKYTLTFDRLFSKKISIQKLTLPTETLTLKEIDPKYLDQIKKDDATLAKIFKTVTKSRYYHGSFISPLDTLYVTSYFGKPRVINGTPRKPHAGLDLRGAEGTDVKATNDGHVVFSDELFLSGKSIIIDHGWGVYSMYFHLSNQKVKKNAEVKKGDVIGCVGKTGYRVSKSHLHFGVYILTAKIDPLLLFKIPIRFE